MAERGEHDAVPRPDEHEYELHRVHAVTDATLAGLDSDKLLAELLARARDLLHADTATVLLLDSTGRELVVVAALGIEEEVRQGVRIPVGSGFAGRVAALREPVVIEHVDAATVRNPLLWQRGLHSLLGVPLLADGRLIGVLHVGAVAAKGFTDYDVTLLRVVADRIALVVHAQHSAADRAAAAALQRSLVPATPPRIAGVEFAARYVPGTDTGVGGDWYDVFALPGDRIGVVVGDVVGYGLPAAVVMGRLRSALRAYALDVDDPGTVLAKLDRKANHFEDGAMATVSYAVVSPGRGEVRLALAGHLPPVFVAPGAAAVLVDAAVGHPIGFPGGANYPTTSLALPPDAVLCFYTDGLVERRDSLIDEGLARLCRAVTATAPESVCARVMFDLVGNRSARDDIAILVMRRQ